MTTTDADRAPPPRAREPYVYCCCWCSRSLTVNETWEIAWDGGSTARMCFEHRDKGPQPMDVGHRRLYGPKKLGRPDPPRENR